MKNDNQTERRTRRLTLGLLRCVEPLERYGIRWPMRWARALCRQETVWNIRREIKKMKIQG